MATSGREGETSPYMSLRSGTRLQGGHAENAGLAYDGESPRARYGPNNSRPSYQDQSVDLRDLSLSDHRRNQEPVASTPAVRPTGLSTSLPVSWGPVGQTRDFQSGIWHPGSTADLFDRWANRPILPNTWDSRDHRAAHDMRPSFDRPILRTPAHYSANLDSQDRRQGSVFNGPLDPLIEVEESRHREARRSSDLRDPVWNERESMDAPFYGRDYPREPDVGFRGRVNHPEVSQGHRVNRHRTSREVPPPQFNSTSQSFIEYIDDFERVADYNGWDQGDRKFHLWNSIVGNAKIRIKTMPYPAQYDVLLRELLTVFSNERTIEGYRDQLTSVKRSSSMDLETYGHHLLDLTRKAHPMAISAEQERVATDKFLETAGSHNLFVWLKANKPRSMQTAIDLAIQFQQATAVNCATKPRGDSAKGEMSLGNIFIGESMASVEVSAASLAPDSSKGSNLEDQVKLLTEEIRALKQQVHNNGAQKSSAKKSPVKCYNCHELGHFKRDCPKLKANALN